jgi:hypothetical protein
MWVRLQQRNFHTNVYCSIIHSSQNAPLLVNVLRNHSIYIQWNFTQPQRRMKFCHLKVKGQKRRTSSKVKLARHRGQRPHVSLMYGIQSWYKCSNIMKHWSHWGDVTYGRRRVKEGNEELEYAWNTLYTWMN